MIISLKDGAKLFGLSVMSCCAVSVCNLFLNYYIDLSAISGLVESQSAKLIYDAQLMTAKVVCAVSGGCLAVTTAIMLFFYIKHYIDSHSREIGVLKALGYSDFKIAKDFSVFGLSVLLGCLAGYLISFWLMPGFYAKQNAAEYMPALSVSTHWGLLFLLVVVPPLVFALAAVLYGVIKLNRPCVELLRGIAKTGGKIRAGKDKKSFVGDMKISVLRSRRALVFFIAFSSFCFSAMIQMSASMENLASEWAGWMIFIIGVVLAFTTLYIAVSSVIRANMKSVAMMRVFGYDSAACKRSVLDGYRPAAYIGFVIGSVYQYTLLKVMVDIVFAGVEGVPEYKFDFPVFFITLGVFAAVYETVMLAYGSSMKKIPLKQIMSE